MLAINDAAIVASLLLFAAWPTTDVLAQAHETSSDNHVLRSSVVSSMSIPEASAARYGIRRAPDLGILNVTVLKKGSQSPATVPARISAHVSNLTGVRRTIEMRETKAEGWVSYTGTFKFAPREVLDFTVSAEPEGDGPPLAMTYRERIWRNGEER